MISKKLSKGFYLYMSDFFSQYPGYAGDSSIPHPLPCEYAINVLNNMRDGFFVDVGSHDGIAWSNTLIFEKLFGWRGISIEANIDLYNELVANRECECLNYAVNDDITEQTFWNITGSASGLGGLESGFKNDHANRIAQELIKRPDAVCVKKQVFPKRLGEILSERNISHIDYLSIDVEGNELCVLKSLDLNHVTVSLISVESNERDAVSAYLTQYGYTLLQKICADDFYARVA